MHLIYTITLVTKYAIFLQNDIKYFSKQKKYGFNFIRASEMCLYSVTLSGILFGKRRKRYIVSLL